MATSDRDRDELVTWLEAAHHPLESLDPDAPPDDLAPLRAIVGDADVVAIGETVRGARSAHELRQVVHRVLRWAVAHLGVRALILEERSLDAAEALDRYVGDGAGPSERVLREAWEPWQSREVLDIVDWLRSWNEQHPDDPVRIRGAISEDELGLAGHVLAACSEAAAGPVVYWGGAAHSAVAPAHDTTNPPRSPPGPSDGWRLRETLGRRYLSIGCICDHAVSGAELPPPPSDFAEAALARVRSAAWFLDLREPDGDVARRWVRAPATTRLIGPRYDPQHDADFCMSGTPFGVWFDAIFYVREITPAQPL